MSEVSVAPCSAVSKRQGLSPQLCCCPRGLVALGLSEVAFRPQRTPAAPGAASEGPT